MPPTPQKIEKLEKKYFEKIKTILLKNIKELEGRFNSKESIRRDYETIGYKENDVETGAERVLASIFCRETNWKVNSAPISSDLLFETEDAMINIDAKTYKEKHKEENKVNVAANQISYGKNVYMKSKRTGTKYTWKSSLKTTYTHAKFGEIPCLTFFVKFIYGDTNKILKRAELISVPNGLLQGTYDKNIFSRGKSKIKPGRPVRDIRVVISKFEKPRLTKGWNRKVKIFS